MPVENTTTNQNYQLPNVANDLEDDVARIVAALQAVDVDVANLFSSIAGFAPLDSAPLTGTPTTPTPAGGDQTTRLANTAFVAAALLAQKNELLGGAGPAFDAFNEIAAALGNDPNYAATMAASLAGKVAKAGDTMTGDLLLGLALAAGDDSTKAASTAFVQSEKIIKKIHAQNSSTDYTRSSQSEGSISDSFQFTPVSATSRLAVQVWSRGSIRSTAGGDDARATIRLSYYDTVSFITQVSNTVGIVNTEPSGATGDRNIVSFSAPFLFDELTSTLAVHTGGDVLFRLRGECDYADNELTVFDFNCIVVEYENVS